jgi:hypothetical protein
MISTRKGLRLCSAYVSLLRVQPKIYVTISGLGVNRKSFANSKNLCHFKVYRAKIRSSGSSRQLLRITSLSRLIDHVHQSRLRAFNNKNLWSLVQTSVARDWTLSSTGCINSHYSRLCFYQFTAHFLNS